MLKRGWHNCMREYSFRRTKRSPIKRIVPSKISNSCLPLDRSPSFLPIELTLMNARERKRFLPRNCVQSACLHTRHGERHNYGYSNGSRTRLTRRIYVRAKFGPSLARISEKLEIFRDASEACPTLHCIYLRRSKPKKLPSDQNLSKGRTNRSRVTSRSGKFSAKRRVRGHSMLRRGR